MENTLAKENSVVSSFKSVDVQINVQSPQAWSNALVQFSDASIYQTWECAAARWGESKLSNIVVSADEIQLAAAMVRTVGYPLALGGVAYVGWGPAWSRRDGAPDFGALRHGLRALRQEYADRRRMFLKVVPNIYVESDHPAKQVFLDEGFAWSHRLDRTIFLDLSPSLDEIRARMRRRWRQTLGKAEKAGLEIVEGTGVDLYDQALKVYQQMHVRKQFAEFVDKVQFRAMQEMLPDNLKMRIILVREHGETIAALAWSSVGDTGLPLLAATGLRALETNAAYLMWWKMIEWLKLNNFKFCDLGGVDPDQNPGGFTFKSGIAGEDARTVNILGEFDCCTNALNRALVAGGIGARNLVRRFRLLMEKARRRQDSRV